MSPAHLQIVQDILREHLPEGVRTWAFGSRVTWTAKEFSDLDLALEGRGPLDADILPCLEAAFGESDLPYKVDVVDCASVSDEFLQIIYLDKILLQEPIKGNPKAPKDFTVREKWQKKPLGEITDLSWGDTKTTKASYVERGFVAFSASGPDGFLPHHDYNRTGVVLSAIGSECGKTWLAKGKWSCIKNTICFFAKSPEVSTEFLYWATKPFDFWPKRGSGQPSISQGDARACLVSFPPILEQRAIANTLGAFDDKIELNRRMNETLEEMARALFKDWFVDFGPTRAKMEGRAPYLAPDLWNLFPDRLDEETGLPEGWQTLRLEQIVIQHKQTLTPLSTPRKLFEHFSIPAFDKKHSPELDKGEKIKSNRTIIPSQSVLLSKLNPQILRVWLTETVSQNQQIASTEFMVFTAKKGFSHSLLFCLFSNESFHSMLLSMARGTSKSHQRISPVDLLRCEVLAGSPRVFKHFETIATLLLERVLGNRAESRTLAGTRDLLLPRLMSGDLRLRDAEAVAASVA